MQSVWQIVYVPDVPKLNVVTSPAKTAGLLPKTQVSQPLGLPSGVRSVTVTVQPFTLTLNAASSVLHGSGQLTTNVSHFSRRQTAPFNPGPHAL
jgi:hypothetical protein